MGVDISLHIEIRRQNQWHLMSVSCPFWEQHEHEYKIFDTQVYNVRYYHFRDFLDEACSHIRCNKDILSSELQALIDDEDAKMGYGVFVYNYGCIFSLRDIVRALTTFGYTHISTSDIRLFYLIC